MRWRLPITKACALLMLSAMPLRAQNAAPPIQRDTNAPTGALQMTLGSPETERNVLAPSFRFDESFDSRPYSGLAVAPGYESVSSFSGTLQMQRSSKRRDFSLSYTGGGVFYQKSSAMNSSYHDFAATQQFSVRRWKFLLSDELTYSPESPVSGPAYGAAGTDPASLLASLAALQPGLLPNQSILTGRTSRLSNTAAAQAQYNFSRYSSWTATGSYGILHFPDAKLLDGNQLTVQTGYNHALGPRTTFSFEYTHQRFGFDIPGAAFQSHAAELGYTRRLTGRLALQAMAGPQVSTFESGLSSRVGWASTASLRYSRWRWQFDASFAHGTSGGSGVFLGSETTGASGGVSRSITRAWRAGATGSYSHSSDLRPGGGLNFDTVSAGGQLYRSLGRSANLYISYSYQRQDSSNCGTICNLLGQDRHIFGIGFDWHLRPIRLGR